jgi:hypothetical protein
MSFNRFKSSVISAVIVVIAGTAAPSALAGGGLQSDIVGPAGSVSFGSAVAVLPNGNIVVTDPDGPVSNVGAVYLYASDGSLINWFTGSTQDDHVGSGGITVLKNGNFVILSPHWHNAKVADAGAVTLVDGITGREGIVTEENSLVGSSQDDAVGAANSVTALANGNYVVATPTWSNGASANAGAATFGDGTAGVIGVVSVVNSLIGIQADDNIGIGGVVALPNGNYVVDSFEWNNGGIAHAGAVTWGNGITGVAGIVSSTNSLVGASVGDFVGASNIFPFPPTNPITGSAGITVLPSSNYIVVSYLWANSTISEAGAVTFADGGVGLSGAVTSTNSLVGARAQDHIGSGGVVVLSNGNYVVASPDCANVSVLKAGAVTWANGSTGLTGDVEPANSLVGTQVNDAVGGGTLIGFAPDHHITALANGDYVVTSSAWSNGVKAKVGAVTWLDGSTSHPGIVSPANSLIGTTANDQVGARGVSALPNSDYVVDSMFWNNGVATSAGAVTLLPGGHRTSATVSSANSLVGTTANDQVGGLGVAALTNGNYVVGSGRWHDAGVEVGAVTWVKPGVGPLGPVSIANSLVGSSGGDQVGAPFALSNGNFVIDSAMWSGSAGAVTWGDGTAGITGTISAANSLIGTQPTDFVGFRDSVALPGGYYVMNNAAWNNGSVAQAGAISLGRGDGSTVGPITSGNSVIGNVANAGVTLVYTYDAARRTLIVGKPTENVVTLFSYNVPNDEIFANGFE